MKIKKVYIHTTKDGTKIPIHRLKKDHLMNIIDFANKNLDKTNKEFLGIYKNELYARNSYPDQLIMDELTRFVSIKDLGKKCIKKDCDGGLYEYYAIETIQILCRKCWTQYQIKCGLSQIIGLDEIHSCNGEAHEPWKN